MKGTATMSTMRNTGSTALLPDWYVDFQTALLQQAPLPGESPGEIDQVTAEGWTNNQKSLKKKLAGCLVPPTKNMIDLKFVCIEKAEEIMGKNFLGSAVAWDLPI